MNIKFPKANASLDRIIPALEYLNSGGTMISRDIFITSYFAWLKDNNVDEYEIIKNKDEGTIWNYTEIWRYVGFAKKDTFKKYIITDNGANFIKCYKDNDENYKNILIKSILQNDYTNQNAGIRNQSNISMPHSIFALLIKYNYLTRKEIIEFLFVLIAVKDKLVALNDFKSIYNTIFHSLEKQEIIKKYINKFKDNKLITLLKNLGILIENNNKELSLWKSISDNGIIQINELSIKPAEHIINRQLILPLEKKELEKRKANLTFQAVSDAGFICEFNNDHQTFPWSKCEGQYMEGHHLIPIELNELFKTFFDYDVDTKKNIFSLCPNCHSAFRSSEIGHLNTIIDVLYDKRKEHYSSQKIDKEIIRKIYSKEIMGYIENKEN